MSDFIVSARKYRPARFDEVVGQQHVSNTLKNALQNNHLAHSFLFCGPRGVGKTTCARILAKTINCENITKDHEACNTCSSCTAFNQNASFNITELDAASNNSVEHIRTLIEQVRFQPQQGKYKVFIIDEVHMLSQAAFNAFLKTLEEPPSYAIFILATTEKHKIIPTILSRCQIFDFRRIQVPAIVEHLQGICKTEKIKGDKDALHIIAQKADGALRDALSIFDRMVSFSEKEITYQGVIENLNVLDYDYFFKIVNAMMTENIAEVLNTFDEILRKGFDPDIFINGLAEHLRNILVCKDETTLDLLEVSDSLKKQYKEQANNAPSSFLLSGLSLANDCDVNYKMARNKRLHVEMTLIKMTYINRAVDLTKQGVPASVPAAVPTKTANFQAAPVPSVIIEPKATIAVEPKTNTPVVKPTKVEKKASKPEKKKRNLNDSSKLSVPSLHNTPSFSLDKIAADIDKAAQNEEVEESRLTNENLQEAWITYVKQVQSPSARNTLRNAELKIEDNQVVATIGTKMARQMILDESGLMPYVREQLCDKRLALVINIDPAKSAQAADTAPKKKKPATNKEIYQNMIARNPLVDDLRKRFDLQPDKE